MPSRAKLPAAGAAGRLSAAAAMAAALLFCMPHAAQARDLEAVADRLVEHLGKLGVHLTARKVLTEGELVMFDDVIVSTHGMEWWGSRLTLTGVEELADRYEIGSAYVYYMVAGDEEFSVQFNELRLEGLRVPRALPLPAGTLPQFDGIGFARLRFAASDQDLMWFRDAHASVETSRSVARVTGAIEEVLIDFTLADPPELRDAMEAMGHLRLRGFAEFDFAVDGAANGVAVESLTVAAPDLGLVSVTGELSGTGNDAGRPPADAGPRLDAWALALKSAEIRYEDEGLAAKLLDQLAAMQGTSPDTIKLQAQALAMMSAGMLVAPENVPQVLTAVQAFLASPRSLTVTASPKEPLPLAEALAGDPGQLTPKLGLTVTANR